MRKLTLDDFEVEKIGFKKDTVDRNLIEIGTSRRVENSDRITKIKPQGVLNRYKIVVKEEHDRDKEQVMGIIKLLVQFGINSGFTDWCDEEYSYKELYELEKLLEDEKINIEIK